MTVSRGTGIHSDPGYRGFGRAAGQVTGLRVATRTGGQTYYLLADHLTSTAITTNSADAWLTELRQPEASRRGPHV